MTALDEDTTAQQRLQREHELACAEMREAETAELRTAARLRVLELEKGMVV